MTAPTPAKGHVPTLLLDHTLRTAPLNVIYGTSTFTIVGSLVGAASGVARGQPAIPAAFKTSINTGVFSFTFFSLREYAVTPLLTHFALHPSPLPPASDPSTPRRPLSVQNPHTNNFVPTTVSGTAAGTIFSYFQRPELPFVRGHVRAGFTLGIGCLVLQSLINEGDLARIKLLNRSEERRRVQLENSNVAPSSDSSTTTRPSPLPAGDSPALAPRPSLLSPLPPSAPSNSSHFSDPTSLTFSERSDLLFKAGWDRFKSAVGSLSPVKKIEPEEYRERLEKARDEARGELERVRSEREELERALKSRE
ncbi:hypothetical protein JCM10212_006575 [Sporobolomyces blumeae]